MRLLFGLACIGAAAVFAAWDAVRRNPNEPDRPCAFCGRLLHPLMYGCDHYLGDGLPVGAVRSVIGRTRTHRYRAKLYPEY